MLALLAGCLPILAAGQEKKPPRLSLSGYIKLTGIARQGYRSDGINRQLLAGDDDAFIDPRLVIDLEYRAPSDRASARLRLVNRHFPDAVLIGAASSDFPQAPDQAATAQIWPELAYGELKELYGPLLLRGGLIPLRYELREVGGAFLIDLPEAERFSDNAPIWAAGGGRGTYQWDIFNQPLYLDLFFLRTLGTEFRESQEAVWGANLDWLVAGPRAGLDNVFNLILAGFSSGGKHIITLGGGSDFHLSDFWELFGEAYAQAGDRGAEGGGRIGARHTWFDRRSEPYIEAAFSYRSAEFVSYENVDTFRILEDNDHGFDVDSNYWSLRLRAGLNLAPAIKHDVLLELLYGYFRTASQAGGLHPQLGHEIDLKLRWRLNEKVTLGAGAALLLDSKHFDERGQRRASMFYLEAKLKF